MLCVDSGQDKAQKATQNTARLAQAVFYNLNKINQILVDKSDK